MRIVVCIKAVKKSLIDSNSVGYIINPYDLYSLMCALTIKKEDNSAEINGWKGNKECYKSMLCFRCG